MRIALAALVVTLVVTAPGLVGSTTLLLMELDQLGTNAVMVVQGHVAWDYAAQPAADRPIYTYTGVEVSRCIAGTCPETVTLKHRGGTVGEWTLYISGMPRFTPGQEVVLFLENDPDGEKDMYYTVGMVQGFFVVTTDPDTGEKTAVQQLGGVTLAAPGPDGTIGPVHGINPIALEVETLVEQVEKALKAAAEGGAE
jgi:hypothetical protein